MGKVSIIIPAYKAEDTILKAVHSALDQGAKVSEVIVVIDGQIDKTASILKSIKDNRLKIIVFENNKGVQKARNTGFENSNGQYVLFLDSDDYLEGSLIEGMLSSIELTKSDICFSPNISISAENKRTYYSIPENIDRFELLVGRVMSTMAVGIQCILWDKKIIDKIGCWDESVIRNQDGDLVIRSLIYNAIHCTSNIGAGCSVQYEGERISKSRTIESFMSQEKIYENVNQFLIEGDLTAKQRVKLRAALNWFCINICVGLSEAGFFRNEYSSWKSKINWNFSHFMLLPKNKAIQVLVFFCFGKKAHLVKNILQRIAAR